MERLRVGFLVCIPHPEPQYLACQRMRKLREDIIEASHKMQLRGHIKPVREEKYRMNLLAATLSKALAKRTCK